VRQLGGCLKVNKTNQATCDNRILNLMIARSVRVQLNVKATGVKEIEQNPVESLLFTFHVVMLSA